MLVFFTVIFILGIKMTSPAAENETDKAIGYYVRAVIPENQSDYSLTYFDLFMNPGEQRQLIVEVTNEMDEAIVVDVETVSASTNRNGIIDYRTPGIRDETLAYPFAEIASTGENSLTIGARQTKQAYININMPETPYDGVILGSIVFTRRIPEVSGSEGGTTIRNRYNYVIGTVLRETVNPVEPDFEMVSVAGQTVNYYPAIVHNIRNKEAAIAKNIEINVQVTDERGNTVARANKAGVDMAPNSVMPLAVSPLVTGQGTERLKSGEYSSEVELLYNGRRWFFARTFVISEDEAKQVNSEIPEREYQGSSDIRFEIILVLIIVILLIVILALIRSRKACEK